MVVRVDRRESGLRLILVAVSFYVAALCAVIYAKGWPTDGWTILTTVSPLSALAFYLAAIITPGANAACVVLLGLAFVFIVTRVPRWSIVVVLALLAYVALVVARKWAEGSI